MSRHWIFLIVVAAADEPLLETYIFWVSTLLEARTLCRNQQKNSAMRYAEPFAHKISESLAKLYI